MKSKLSLALTARDRLYLAIYLTNKEFEALQGRANMTRKRFDSIVRLLDELNNMDALLIFMEMYPEYTPRLREKIFVVKGSSPFSS